MQLLLPADAGLHPAWQDPTALAAAPTVSLPGNLLAMGWPRVFSGFRCSILPALRREGVKVHGSGGPDLILTQRGQGRSMHVPSGSAGPAPSWLPLRPICTCACRAPVTTREQGFLVPAAASQLRWVASRYIPSADAAAARLARQRRCALARTHRRQLLAGRCLVVLWGSQCYRPAKAPSASSSPAVSGSDGQVSSRLTTFACAAHCRPCMLLLPAVSTGCCLLWAWLLPGHRQHSASHAINNQRLHRHRRPAPTRQILSFTVCIQACTAS